MWLVKCLLILWTLIAAGWWICACWLAWRHRHAKQQAGPAANRHNGHEPVSIFKPLTGLRGAAPATDLIAALESFVAQLHDGIDLLFGVEQADAAAWQPVFDRWHSQYPTACFGSICQTRPTTFRNPRGSWWHALAPHARGKLWLWSDADIIAPPDLLATLRDERATSGATLVTCPYVVREITAAAACLEALFVNTEFFPGVLACQSWGRPTFAFGAGLLFSAADFEKHLRWDEVGGRIADDNLIGSRLGPVHISRTTVATLASETGWVNALLHYHRRHKTVRWCRPGGYAALLLIMPVLGWFAAVAAQPTAVWAWTGLAATMLMEMVAAMSLFRLVGCQSRRRHRWVIGLWPTVRTLTWLACWLPWPVVFRSQRRIWWSLHRCSGGPS